MKAALLIILALSMAGCRPKPTLEELTGAEQSPAPITPAPSPTPKPGAWMWEKRENKLDAKNAR